MFLFYSATGTLAAATTDPTEIAYFRAMGFTEKYVERESERAAFAALLDTEDEEE